MNNTVKTLIGVVGSVCGDSTIEAIKNARSDFPQGDRQKIWYEIANPHQFVFDDAKLSWGYAVFGGTGLAIGAIVTVGSIIGLVATKCPTVLKRTSYARLDSGAAALDIL